MYDKLIAPASRLLKPPGLWVPAMEFAPSRRCCCEEESGTCPYCDGTPGSEIQVVVDGFANEGCDECTLFNGTFIVPGDEDPGDVGCIFLFQGLVEGELVCGNPVSINCTFSISFGDFVIQGSIGNPSEFYRFERNYGSTKPSCDSLVDENIPFKDVQSDVGQCDESSATFVVTSLP